MQSLLRSRPCVSAPRPSARIAPVVVGRRVAPIVCSAAVEIEPVAGVKSGMAKQTFQRGSVHKVRRILDVVRGRSYEEALMLCEYMPYKACEVILKVLMSAAANAKHNQGALKTKLYVKECFADGGPSLSRARPRAQGRAYKILKPTFHLTIKVEEKES